MKFAIYFLTSLILGCSHSPKLHQPCLDSDKACLKQAAKKHPVQTLAFWEPLIQLPVDQRFFQAPAEIIDYVLLQNRLQNFPEKPRAIAADAEFINDFKQALFELPPEVKKLLDVKLLAIFLAQDIGGSAITDFVRDSNGDIIGSFIVFDQISLNKKANDWGSWKDSTVFKSHPDWQLQMTLAHTKDNNRKVAISFILLHELGHVLAAGGDFHPAWDGQAESPEKKYPFTKISWPFFTSFMAPEYVSAYDKNEFPLRSKIKFYSKNPKLEARQMPEVYRQLALTKFVSLYAATNPGDDFAESFATYVHHLLQGRPYKVTVLHKGKEVGRIELCWNNDRCREKRAILESFLRQ
jgi:hypothetical protein